MKKYKIFKRTILALMLVIGWSGCELDERADDLTCGYQGAFIDKITGDTIASEYYASKIKLLDLAYGNRAIPLEYDVQPTGSYTSSKVFPSDYKIWATGPFFELDTLYDNLQDRSKKMDLMVTPNVSLTIKDVSIKYGIAVDITFAYKVNDTSSTSQEIGLVYSTGKYPGFRTAMDETQNSVTKKRNDYPHNIR